ncbi:hypothetical protein PIB30_076621 [Stylosanthes scabra]|uniref:Uncharacterized protein n=1 Tax=Stylosanthes scabra TaxID=79078 RepID=A0ABU6UU12_9FABA|nr:hypothetical protein [Stylosanthes scabra]
MIKQDDRTEEPKSFSTARVLLDSFQWEMIHERVSLKVDDIVFEVFVKEFGSEVYSDQAHPHLMEETSASLHDGSGSPGSAVKVTLASSMAIPATFEIENSNNVKVGDPLIEELIYGGEWVGEEYEESSVDFMRIAKVN